jgi:kynurenine formamidase
MTVIDLTHFVEPGMPVYPGTEPPLIRNATTIAEQGFAEKRVSLFSHTGTHMDAPGHMLEGAPTLDALPIDRFAGPGLVIDLPTSEPGRRVTAEDLTPWEADLARVDFALFRFDWSRFWGRPEYFQGYPVLSQEAAARMAGFPLKGIGVDCISVDPWIQRTSPSTSSSFGAQDLDRKPDRIGPVIGRRFLFSCFPWKLKDADGSPVRAAPSRTYK